MSNLDYQKQSVDGLKYVLFSSPDPVLNINVLKVKETKWQDITFEFSIIGASHFVKMTPVGSDSLVELIACIKPGNQFKCDLYQDINLTDKKYSYDIQLNNEFKYSINSWFINEKLTDYQQFQNQYRLNQGIYLDYLFPAPDGLAITSIEIIANRNQFSWITFHSYPEDNKILKTLSILRKGE